MAELAKFSQNAWGDRGSVRVRGRPKLLKVMHLLRDPAARILHGRLDINVLPEQAELLDRNLAAAGVPHALVSLPWAGHAFDLVHFDTPGAQVGRYAIVRFLESVTR